MGSPDCLQRCGSEGLDPADYRAQELSALSKALEAGSPGGSGDVASFDVGVSLSMMRYLRHFHRGRVDPRDIGFLMTLPADEHDYPALVRDAALQSRVMKTIASMAPPLVQYRSLRSMLPRYRALAADTTGARRPTTAPVAAPRKPRREAMMLLIAWLLSCGGTREYRRFLPNARRRTDGLGQPPQRTTRTEQWAVRTTFSATLPSSARDRPRRP